MIKLYSFGPAFGLIDPSPFVTKVNLFMLVNDIEFEIICDFSKLQKAPKKKLPVIDDDGNMIADSMFILDYLSDKYNVNMDHWLTEEQRATAHLIGKSLEENLFLVFFTSINVSFIEKSAFPLDIQLNPGTIGDTSRCPGVSSRI